VADSDLHQGRLSRGGPNSVPGPPNQRGGPLAPPAGALTKGAPAPTAWIHGPAQQKGGPRSSRPPRRWPTQVCTGAACPEAAQTVSWGRLTKEAALSRRRRAPSQKKRPRRRRGYTALPSRGAGRDPAGLPGGGRLRFTPGPLVQRRPKQCPGAALPKWRPSCTAGGRPHKRGAHVEGVDTRPFPAVGRAAIQPAYSKVADSGLHRGRLSRGGPNSVPGPPNQRGGPLAPPAGALTKGAPAPTAWIHGPAQQKGGPRSSRPPRRWPTEVCTGAACPEAAQTVSWGRLTKETALLHRRRAPSQKGRPRRRRGYAALPSSGAGRDPAGLPEGGRLMI